MKKLAAFLVLLIILYPSDLCSQQETGIDAASMAVERLLDQKGDSAINNFIEQYMAGNTDRDAMTDKIKEIQKELKGLRDGIGLDMDNEGAILSLSADDVEKRLRISYDHSRQQVTDLFIMAPEEKLNFELDNLGAAVQYMKDQNMAGLIYLKSEGEVLLEEPFGMANQDRNIPNSRETIFAIGSRPIDFTVASILLLDQRGVLSIDDPLSEHLENVPADKQNMTIKHLMSGQSGLPDFFHNEDDWDADLQWISREEAIRRLLNQKLLFAPGKGNSHSHGAFGLLAALVEIKSGKSYIEFLEENFFTPAGMTRTGEYGDKKEFEIADFAVGGGPQFIGLPNIPPNWGPTSWLVKGSGGMYSTLGDLLKFYELLRDGDVLDTKHSRYFKGDSVNVDGSMRGFELFSGYFPGRGEIYLFLNNPGDPAVRRKIFRAFEDLVDR